jgi:hypothetical protein
MDQQPASQPSEQPTAEPPESSASPGKPWWRLLSRSWTQKQLDLVISAVASAVCAVIGIAKIPWWGLLVATAFIAAVAVCAAHAINARTKELKASWWRTSFLLTLLLLVSGFIYHQWLDPATQAPKTYKLVVNGTNSNTIPLFGEAGGEPLTIESGPLNNRGLNGGQQVEVDCWVIGRDGQRWVQYQRFGGTWYAPQVFLHPPAGLRQPDIPHC